MFDDDGPTVDVGNETTSGTSGSVPLTLAQLNLDETFDIAPPASDDRYAAGRDAGTTTATSTTSACRSMSQI